MTIERLPIARYTAQDLDILDALDRTIYLEPEDWAREIIACLTNCYEWRLQHGPTELAQGLLTDLLVGRTAVRRREFRRCNLAPELLRTCRRLITVGQRAPDPWPEVFRTAAELLARGPGHIVEARVGEFCEAAGIAQERPRSGQHRYRSRPPGGGVLRLP